MPRQEESTMELRRQCIQDVQSGATPVTELCAAYQISRKTAYKWLTRYEAGGRAALADRSRRPHTCPTATPSELVEAVLAARARHPTWGPRKLLRLLQQQLTSAAWPARSTLALHLKRAGLVLAPRRVRHPGHPGRPQAPMDAPNAIWTADFKGQVRLGDGSLCYPLTIADGSSRLQPAAAALPRAHQHPDGGEPTHLYAGVSGVWPAGPHPLPQRGAIGYAGAGPPVPALGLVGAARDPARLDRAGLAPAERPARAHASHPQGRVHPTATTLAPRPAAPLRHLAPRVQFNELRPHQALADATPASHYQPSPRPYPTRLPPLEYPGHYEVRRVSRNGGIRWRCTWVNVSQTLGGEAIGFVEIDDGAWDVYFGPLRLGRFHERTLTIEEALGRQYRRHY